MNQNVEEFKNFLENDTIKDLSIEEIESIFNSFLESQKQKEQDILDKLILKNSSVIFQHDFKPKLQVSFPNFSFLIFFDQYLKVKFENDSIDFNSLNSFNETFQEFQSFLDENRNTILFLFDNVMPKYKIGFLKNKISSLIKQRKKDFIESIICSSITNELLKSELPKHIFSVFINDQEEIKFKTHNIKIQHSLFSRKKIQYLIDNDYCEDYNIINKTPLEIELIFEKEIKARLSNSTTQSYFSDPIEYKNHIENRTQHIIKQFDRYKTLKEEIKISIDNSKFKHIDEFKNLKFLSKEDKLLSLEDIKLLPNNIDDLYEYCLIKQQIKDF